MAAGENHKLGDLIGRLRDTTAQDRVAIEDMMTAIGGRGIIPFLLVPALLTMSPLSGVPGFSATAGLIIATVSVYMLLNRDSVSLPGFVERRTVDGAKLEKALSKVQPLVDWIDRHTRRRWHLLFTRPIIWVPQGLCLLSGMVMPFLEFIPFTSSIVATGVFLLALSLLVRDGRLFIIALLPYAAVITIAVKQLA
ncbi:MULTISPECIES: exopolysaccharide biosynthesis protein [unclassified Yoonia]|uniref:exopolysaccharide biosynthesis protein n=1 Tax=unclassified Yoonia TaxID=2629118 RepID=UPI002AFED13A|nr:MULTISPECIES: exopolysaccharide biosynthesis protein [unclassified Yoonia]